MAEEKINFADPRGGAAVARARALRGTLGLDTAPTVSTTQPPPDPRLQNPFQITAPVARTVGLAPGGGGGFEQQLQGLIAGRLGGLSGMTSLPQLGAEDLAQLEAIRAAQEGQLQQVFGENKDALLRDLFGRGVERSTIAGRAGGQLLGQEALARLQLESDAAQRQFGLRRDIGQLNVQQAGIIAQSLSAFNDARSRVQSASIAANAQVEASRLSADAQLQVAQLSDATRRALGFGDLDLRERQLQFDIESLDKRLQNQLDVAKIGASAGKPSLLQRIFGGAAAGIGGIGASKGGGVGKKILGGVLSALPFFSTAAVKTDIERIDSTDHMLKDIVETPLFKYRYLWEDKTTEGIVIEASPDKFNIDETLIHLPNIVTTLMGAVQAQQKQIEELQRRLEEK